MSHNRDKLRSAARVKAHEDFAAGVINYQQWKDTAELVDNKAPLLKTPVSKKEADKIIADLAEQEIQLEAIEVSAENPFLASQEYGC